MDKASKLVNLTPELTRRLERNWEEKKKKKPETPAKWGTFVQQLIVDTLDKEDFLSRIAPGFESLGIHNNILFIKDSKRNGTAEIYLKDSELYCEMDKSVDCDHIHFAWALPELAKLQLKKR